jgi:acetylornithine deacetylase
VSSAAPGWDQSNRGVIDTLAEWAEEAGFAVERLPVEGEPGKSNLIATFGRGAGGLVLAGHTDTVPYDLSRWTSDPFVLREAEGKLFGLGTSDMKGFLALALEAVAGLDPDTLSSPVVLLATADEESSMAGARALVRAQRPRGRHAVIGEPTDMRPVRAHKGVMLERLRVIGRSGHASDPRLGNSALDGMAKVLDAVIAFRTELAQRFANPIFELPSPTMNLGRIHGGDSGNRICGECELDVDVRVLPGMDVDALRVELRQRAEHALSGTGLVLEHRPLFLGSPPHELSPEAPILKATEELTGEGAVSVAFGTEAPFLAELGADTIVMGPGDIAQAHKPDEYLRVDRLAPTVDVLRGLVQRFCVAP